MASNQEEKCARPINEVIQNSSGSGEKKVVFTEQQQFHEQQQAEGSTVKQTTETSNDGTENFVQQPSTNRQTSKGKRPTQGNDEKIYFEIFKIQNGGEQYILKLHEIASRDYNSYRVKLKNKDGEKWSVGICKLDKQINDSDDLMEEDVDPPIFHKKYNLPLSERLRGWTLENRKREKGKVDKFYYHQKRQFRSLVEVAGFLLYSCKPKDLKPLTTIVNVSESLEEEVATALILLSNGEAYDSQAQRATKEYENASLGEDKIVKQRETLSSKINYT